MPHPFHQAIGNFILNNIPKNSSIEVYLDQACKVSSYSYGDHQIPFFINYYPSRSSAVSKVDVIACRNDKVIFACEIEESGFNPTKIYGKVFSTSSAKVCRINLLNSQKTLELDNKSTFLQIISNKNFPKDTFKEVQGTFIENDIVDKINKYQSWINHYRLLYGNETDLQNSNSNFTKEFNRILQSL